MGDDLHSHEIASGVEAAAALFVPGSQPLPPDHRDQHVTLIEGLLERRDEVERGS